MIVAIEAQRIFRPNKHGMDFVILEILRQLQATDDGTEYYVFVAPGDDRCIESSPNMHIVELSAPGSYPVWEQYALPRAVRQCGASLLHCTSNTAPLHSPVPLLLTLHDIIFLKEANTRGMSWYQKIGWYYRRWNIPRIVSRCRHIITVSQSERQNILATFPQLEGKISAVHNGVSPSFYPLPEDETTNVLQKYGVAYKNYFFCLGNTDPRKNLTGVLKAYHTYRQNTSNPKDLVLTGLSSTYLTAFLKENKLESIAPFVKLTGYLPSADLPAFYNGAFAFLFPSLYEGFGIPVIESMACGTPVIASNTSATPEVAGHDAILINPANPEEIAQAMTRLEKEETSYQKQVAYGLERAKLFSWKNAADAYRRIYRLASISS